MIFLSPVILSMGFLKSEPGSNQTSSIISEVIPMPSSSIIMTGSSSFSISLNRTSTYLASAS